MSQGDDVDMVPSSPLAGLFTGLVDGAIVLAFVLLVVFLLNRRHHGQPVQVHPVAEDNAPRLTKTRTGELPKLHDAA